ncbi:MAG TPA: FAD-dependent oxidoreductase [Burkholderiales bacterium]|nr:FAD-dependent oxidoreductase [Burkholderiales bacterium]
MIVDPIVIIGSGLAGYNVARELRKLDREAPLAIITADGGEFYSKPTLSNALASGKAPAAIALNTAEQMATQLDATIRTRTRVTAIEPGLHRIRLGDDALGYTRLVLALGAGQIRLPIAGNAADRILTVNSLDDYTCFRSALEGKRCVAIIGAGLIGCEFANDLAASGHRVECIDIAAQALPRLLPAAGASFLQEKLSAIGVKWHLGTTVISAERSGDAIAITLANGVSLAADLVLSAIGLKPNVDLAQAAGLAVRRGILVDRALASSTEGIHALGDCAEVEGKVLPFVMPIMHAARALAATLAGKHALVTYPAMPVLVKTPACPTIVAPPADGAAGEWLVERTADGVKALYLDSAGKLLGFALNGGATAERAKLARDLPAVLG